MAMYYVTRVVGTKQFSNDVKELKQGIEDVWKGNKALQPYLAKEWIFDSASANALEEFILKSNI